MSIGKKIIVDVSFNGQRFVKSTYRLLESDPAKEIPYHLRTGHEEATGYDGVKIVTVRIMAGFRGGNRRSGHELCLEMEPGAT